MTHVSPCLLYTMGILWAAGAGYIDQNMHLSANFM